MTFDAHKNFAYSTVATAPSPASSGTSMVVAAGDGAKFPAVPFNATIWPASSQPTTANAEIVRVTGRSTDTLTIVRAQENTSARTVIVGDQIAEAITAKTLTDVETAATATPGSFSFVLYDNYQRFTITDANVTTASKIIGTIRRPNIEQADDTGWFYDFNVVKVANGSFDVNVFASQWGENADPDLSTSPLAISNLPGGNVVGVSDQEIGINGPGGARERLGAPFTPTVSGKVASILVWAGLGGVRTDALLVEIESDAAGVPSGTALGVGGQLPAAAVSGVTFNNFLGRSRMDFIDHPVLTAGTQYWIVFSTTTLDASNTWVLSLQSGALPSTLFLGGGVWQDFGFGRLFFSLIFEPVYSSEELTLNYLLPA